MSEGPQELLNQTEFTQPAVFATSYLAYLNHGIQGKVLIGHSVGEYTALTIAGFLNPIETVKLLRKRGQLMQEACEGRKCGMLVVSGDIEKTLEIKENVEKMKEFKGLVCELAVYNSKKNHVFSGDLEILKGFSESLKKEKINNVFLRVSAAFHCSLMEKIQGKFRDFLEKIEIFEGNRGVVLRNCDLKAYRKREDVIEGLVKQLNCPVLFYQSVNKAIDDESIKEIVEFAGKSQVRSLNEIIEGRNDGDKIKIRSV